ncbi:TCR/Tet family MFS transporter [Phenylobacterium sp.]|uniref:TCR/Tet family MFS transporter n=1 Tax=Phenylobacterium sp. TaxID=1871053 RepID=UPI0008D4CE1E|nr:TCR/Tet family MFS transporter [Phenylobacterium sp.]MBA4792401.1 TCR/Tet family MFS transporter [Phenylobacterium sp.]OHB39138.1 MAG: tetracycline resistance MFS efflux pump [Phenylobacterium sp. RIFCSPHIGHO2_01_FULL_70_10]
MIGQTSGQSGRRAAFGFIFATALMNAVSFGLIIPVLPNLIKQFTGGDTAQAAEWNVIFAVTWGAMQFVCGPLLGLLSDRVGRRPVLLLSVFGLALDFLIIAVAPNLIWLLVGRVLNGMTAASFSTANAYVADVTPPEGRAKAFGLMGSAFSFGFMVGPAIGGALGDIDLRLPFYVAAGLSLVNGFYGLFVLPESLPPEKRTTRFDLARANPLGSLRLLRSHPDLLGLATIGLLFQLAHTVLPAIFVLYTGYRYGWSPSTMGLTMMATGVAGVVVQMFLVGPVVARIGERGALLLGAAGGAAGFAWYGFAPTGTLYLVGVPIFALVGFLMPGLQGLMTRRVAPHEQGQLQGANQSLQGIASMAGPALFGLTFAWSIRHAASLQAPGLAIYLASALLAAAFVLGSRVARAPVPVQA